MARVRCKRSKSFFQGSARLDEDAAVDRFVRHLVRLIPVICAYEPPIRAGRKVTAYLTQRPP